MWSNTSATTIGIKFFQVTRTKSLFSLNVSNVVIFHGLKFGFTALVWTLKVMFDADLSLWYLLLQLLFDHASCFIPRLSLQKNSQLFFIFSNLFSQTGTLILPTRWPLLCLIGLNALFGFYWIYGNIFSCIRFMVPNCSLCPTILKPIPSIHASFVLKQTSLRIKRGGFTGV